ncbi:DUF1576 domain-containing protein [Haloimpatiens sp. FM7315]|uniref:DUF1576 domain-containing protein n=1 Tax=Haloimpatiens sp. FM7315 TaxID=3298609 RepID=UPI003709F438
MKTATKKNFSKTYYILLTYYLSFLIFAFIIDTPSNIFKGMKNIILEPDILITDYIAIGGIGATFVNSALLSIIIICILIFIGIKPNGSTLAALLTTTGFGFFGKNILNVWPIFFGVWLYSKYQKEPFFNYILIAIFGTTLSPTVVQFKSYGVFTNLFALSCGIIISISMGFILPPIASYCMKLHQGYNLYNTGLAAGLLSTVLMSILRAVGINFPSRLFWSKGNNNLFLGLLLFMFLSMIILGYFLDKKAFKKLPMLFKESGVLISDFYIVYGSGVTFINMGILGIVYTCYILIIGGDLNGPTLGGLFTVVGFGGFGKHIKNTLPIVIGTALCSLLNIWPINSPSMILAALFSTTLAPISGHFGWIFGLISGFLHVCIAMNVAYLHGGLNLYNNGFAGGIVAMFLVPLIIEFRKDVLS